MAKLVLFNKPFNVLCQFTDSQGRDTLSNYIDIPAVYAAGRLDTTSEGLLLLTDDGKLQNRISDPKHKTAKVYWAQVDGDIDDDGVIALAKGVQLNDGMTSPATVKKIAEPELWQRVPPIRYRANIPTSWIQLSITEGRNRQVRRMTAAVGYPTLRLVRVQIGEWKLGNLQPAQYRVIDC